MKHISQFQQTIYIGSALLLSASAFTLTACGGDDSGSSEPVVVTPPPPPSMATKIDEFSVSTTDGPHRIIMPGGHADDTLTGTCRPDVAGRSITWSSNFSRIEFSDPKAETTMITAGGTGSLSGEGDITCTLDDDTSQSEDVQIYVNAPGNILYKRNPLRMNDDGNPRIDSDFILKSDTPASNNVNQCFSTTLDDLEAVVAWQSSGAGLGSGNYCASVHDYEYEFDGEIRNIDIVKMYAIPGSFIVQLTPYATALFGEVVLQSGMETQLPTRRLYSDGDIAIGGVIGTIPDTPVVDQFGVSPYNKLVSITIKSLDESFNDSEKSYTDCIKQAAHYSGLGIDYAEYESIWCETKPDKWKMVSWAPTPVE